MRKSRRRAWVAKVRRELTARRARKNARWYGGFEAHPLILPGSPDFKEPRHAGEASGEKAAKGAVQGESASEGNVRLKKLGSDTP